MTRGRKQATNSIGNLLYRFDVVAGNQLVIGVKEFDTRLLEGTLS